MSSKALAEAEKASLNLVLEDLRFLFDKEEIDSSDLNTVLNNLKSEEVKTYLNNLFTGSKPETALRESFFTSDSTFAKFLYGYAQSSPEVVENGFVDYLIKDELGHIVVLELKSLFYSQKEKNKAGAIKVKKLKQQVLDWSKHKEQIKSYITKGDYVILTNLKEWFFFSRSLNPINPKPFFMISLHKFIVEYENYGKNFKEFCDRKEYQAIRYELDKEFLGSLDRWVKKLSAVKFKADEKRRVELIIGLINKFIFIQTLDDHGVIGFKWIQNNWQHYESQWVPKGKAVMLEEFLSAVNKWFFKYYDTELFKEDALKHVEKEKENIELFYETLRDVLGVTYLQKPIGFKGIIQYNFRLIDEDVLGKAYETFLAKVRKEEGIYYTPKYITQYIAQNTVGRVLDELLAQIEEKMEKEEFEGVKELVLRFTSIRVLDPACGSGSFLIKAIRIIVKKYRKLNQLTENCIKKYSNYMGSLDLPQEVRAKLELLSEIKEIVGPRNDRELIARILVRHIHGVDLDKRALEVAKVNIWLEAIKLAPKEFRYDRLPADTNYILPNLRMNLRNGDSLVELPENMSIEFLNRAHKDDIVKLYALRQKYLDSPTNPDLVKKIEGIKNVLEGELNGKFKEYLKRKELPPKIFDETKPFHWPLQFWYFYFDESGEPVPENLKGTDVLIGNPPYERIQILNKKTPTYVQYLNNAGFESAFKNYDLAVIFIERGFKLLKQNGEFGYIVTHKFMQADYGEPLREFISRGKFIKQIINFGDQQVFDDATTYTALLFLRKSENNKLKYSLIKKLQRSLNQLLQVKNIDAYDDENITTFTQESSFVTKEPWIFAQASEEAIFKKVGNLPKLAEVCRIFVGLQTSADRVYVLNLIEDKGSVVKVYSRSRDLEYILEKDFLKPMLMGRDIKRWWVDEFQSLVLFPYEIQNGKAVLLDKETLKQKYPKTWRYLLDNKEDLGKRERGTFVERPDWYGYVYLKNMDKFDLPKIMTQVLANRSVFAIDSEGKYYFPGGGNAGGYGVIPKEQSLSLKFLCALLNSSLLDWNLKKISTRFRGGFYSYAKRFSGKLPIKLPEAEEEKAMAETIEKLVERICSLKRGGYTVLDMWREWSTKLKNSERSLLEILIQDKESMQAGKFEETWASEVTFFPESDHEIMDKPFYKFEIRGDMQIPNLKIYGVSENNEEELIYEMEFGNRDLMLHVYCSLLEALRSRAKIKTFYHLLTKTAIPIIKEVNKSSNELTLNIIKKVRNEFEDWLRQNKIEDTEADIVKINNEIEDLEAKIDASVFKLYELEEEEIKVVFDSLKTPTIYQGKVLEFFRKL